MLRNIIQADVLPTIIGGGLTEAAALIGGVGLVGGVVSIPLSSIISLTFNVHGNCNVFCMLFSWSYIDVWDDSDMHQNAEYLPW